MEVSCFLGTILSRTLMSQTRITQQYTKIYTNREKLERIRRGTEEEDELGSSLVLFDALSASHMALPDPFVAAAHLAAQSMVGPFGSPVRDRFRILFPIR